MKSNYFVAFLVLFIMLFSCKRTGEKIKQEFMPMARGEIGEVILVMDSSQYAGRLGKEIRDTYRAPMVGLPQDESLFNINKASPLRLNSVLKSATNMIFVFTLNSNTRESKALRGYFTNESLKKIYKDSSIFMTMRRDEFAKGQFVLYLFGQNEDQLSRKIAENRDNLQDLFEKVERRRLQDRLFKSQEKEIMKVIEEDHGVSLKVPFGWDLARNLKNFVWIRLLDADKEQDVFIYYEPYNNAEVFSDLEKFRDRITETYLRDSGKPELYITHQSEVNPITNFTKLDDKYAVKYRGLWKNSDNSGGGPFISYTLVDEATSMLYYIEGYVYAPGTTKRNFVRQVDAIISTFKVKPEDK